MGVGYVMLSLFLHLLHKGVSRSFTVMVINPFFDRPSPCLA